MISPMAMEEAARTAGLFSWRRRGQIGGEDIWRTTNSMGSVELTIGCVEMQCTAASFLRSAVAARGEEVQQAYILTVLRMTPDVLADGPTFAGDDLSICASMHALGHWSERMARAVYHDYPTEPSPSPTSERAEDTHPSDAPIAPQAG